MLVSQFITKLRQFTQDHGVATRDKFDGDGSTKAFRTKFSPILESLYAVKVGGIVQNEPAKYSLDKNTGLIEFVTAPIAGSDNVTIDYQYVNLTDEEWLEIINDIIREWREKVWTEGQDEATLTTVANQSDYDLDSISANIFAVIGLWFRTSSSVDWVSVDRDTNVKYLKEQNKINLRPYFDVGGYAMKVRYLAYLSEQSATTDTFNVDSRYHSAFIYACASEYYDRFAAGLLTSTGAVSSEKTFEGMMNVSRLADKFKEKSERILSRIKPTMPTATIASSHLGIKG